MKDHKNAPRCTKVYQGVSRYMKVNEGKVKVDEGTCVGL